MEETLSYVALPGWYDIDSETVFKLLSATDKRWSTCRAHLLRLQTIQDEPIVHPVSQQVYHVRETHVRGVSVKGSPLAAVIIHVWMEQVHVIKSLWYNHMQNTYLRLREHVYQSSDP